MKITVLAVTATYLAIVTGGLFSELRAASSERASLSVLADNPPGASDLAASATVQSPHVMYTGHKPYWAMGPTGPHEPRTRVLFVA